jgi:hypothetical protein
MHAKQNAVAVAVSAMVGSAKAATKAKPATKAKAAPVETRGTVEGWLNDPQHGATIGADAFRAYVSEAQADKLEEFAALALERAIATDTFIAAADALVRDVWPTPCTFDTWQPVARAMRSEVSEYAAKCLRDAYKRVHTALPSAGTPSVSTAPKGGSAKKAAKGIHTAVADMVERLAKLDAYKADVNGPLLAEFAAAVAALATAEAKLFAAVAE